MSSIVKDVKVQRESDRDNIPLLQKLRKEQTKVGLHNQTCVEMILVAMNNIFHYVLNTFVIAFECIFSSSIFDLDLCLNHKKILI